MLSLMLLAIVAINGLFILMILFHLIKLSFCKKRLLPTYSLEEIMSIIPSLGIKELKVLRLIVSEEIKRYSPPELLTIVRLVKLHSQMLTKSGRKTLEIYFPEVKVYYTSLKSFSQS